MTRGEKAPSRLNLTGPGTIVMPTRVGQSVTIVTGMAVDVGRTTTAIETTAAEIAIHASASGMTPGTAIVTTVRGTITAAAHHRRGAHRVRSAVVLILEIRGLVSLICQRMIRSRMAHLTDSLAAVTSDLHLSPHSLA